jgi:fatty-acid desaturase
MHNIVKIIKLLIVIGLMSIGLIETVEIFLNFGNQWYWLLLAMIYTVTLNDTFVHRICAHGMFLVNEKSITYKILTWLSTADLASGPVKSSVLNHELHHIHADTGPKDNMKWDPHWYCALLLPIAVPIQDVDEYQRYTKKRYKTYHHLLNDPWTNFCAKHQIEISLITWTVLFLISPIVFFKVICVGRFMISLMHALAALVGHSQTFPLNYRNFNTNDKSSNNIFLYYLFLGLAAGLLQNNHHGKPSAINVGSKWWEIDTSSPIAHLLKFLMGKKT